MTVTWLVAGRTGPNAARIMSKVHDMWVNSLAALLGAFAAIRSQNGLKNKTTTADVLSWLPFSVIACIVSASDTR